MAQSISHPRILRLRLQTGSRVSAKIVSVVNWLINFTGISPITVVTHRDKLKTIQECEDALDLASAATGSSRSHTFFVANYCDEITERNLDTEEFVFDILHFALLTAERYVKIAKQQQKIKTGDALREAMESTHLGGPPSIIPNGEEEERRRRRRRRSVHCVTFDSLLCSFFLLLLLLLSFLFFSFLFFLFFYLCVCVFLWDA